MKQSAPQNSDWIKRLPNILTVGRLALTVVFLAMILYAPHTGKTKPTGLLMTAFTLFLIAGITDIIDGYVARTFNASSKFGRTADPLADKILVCGAFFCFAIVGQPLLQNFKLEPSLLHAIRWGTAAIIFARELLVQTLRHLAESRGVNFGAVTHGKIKMFLQSFGIGTVIVGWAYVSRPWGDWIVIIIYLLLVAFTVYSGVNSLKRPIR